METDAGSHIYIVQERSFLSKVLLVMSQRRCPGHSFTDFRTSFLFWKPILRLSSVV